RAPHQAGHARYLGCEARIAVSRLAPARGERLARIRVGRIGKQPPRQVLQTHQGGPASASGRGTQLGARLAGHRPRAAGRHVKETQDEPLPRLSSLLRNLFRKDRVERDLDSEVSAYLDQLVEEKISAGMAPEQARRAARIEVGGPEQV